MKNYRVICWYKAFPKESWALGDYITETEAIVAGERLTKGASPWQYKIIEIYDLP
jgi:hypothetical protein